MAKNNLWNTYLNQYTKNGGTPQSALPGMTEFNESANKTVVGGGVQSVSELAGAAGTLLAGMDAVSRNSGNNNLTRAANELNALYEKTAAASDRLIAEAKEGKGVVEQFLVDLGVEGTKRGGDALANFVVPGAGIASLGARTFGSASQQARKDGASVGQQFIYGTGRAISRAAIEKWFDGLSGIYGKSLADDMAANFAKKVKGGEIEQKIAKAAIDDAGEVLESVATSFADELLKTVYNGKNARETLAETEWGRVGRNLLISTILDILSGDSGMR